MIQNVRNFIEQPVNVAAGAAFHFLTMKLPGICRISSWSSNSALFCYI